MNPFLNKKAKNQDNQFKPKKNEVLNYQNNSNNKNNFSTSLHSYSKTNVNINESESKSYNKISDRQSFESMEERGNVNENNQNNNDYKISDYNETPYNNEIFNSYKYYEPSNSIYNSLPLNKKGNNFERINNNTNNYQNSVTQKKEYEKYNPNYFNKRKQVNPKKMNKNKISINSISNNNFMPKKANNTIINSKYGELSKKKILNEKNNISSSQYYDSFNNNYLNYLAQTNYNEDSFNEEVIEENKNINNTLLNKMTIYDLRKKKSMTDGQTFFIKKAENSKNYQFFESKRIKKVKPGLVKNNIKKSEFKKEVSHEDNKNDLIKLEKEENEEPINNHNFIIIKSNSIQNKKIDENDNKVKVDNYNYKETKVKGPNNHKPIMKLRIGINGEKFYEKFIPEKKVIKYTYEPVCRIINSKNMNNIGFKKIISHCHSGIRKKYKKINPKNLIAPASNVIITSDSCNYSGNVIEKINDNTIITNNKSNNEIIKNEKNETKILRTDNIRQRRNVEKENIKKA